MYSREDGQQWMKTHLCSGGNQTNRDWRGHRSSSISLAKRCLQRLSHEKRLRKLVSLLENARWHLSRCEDASDKRAETFDECCGHERCGAKCVLPRVRSELRSTERQAWSRNSSEAKASSRSMQFYHVVWVLERPTKEEDRTDTNTMPELAPVEMPMEITLHSADASRSETVPEVEVEQEVGFKSEEPLNVRPLRTLGEPTKEERDAHETSGHVQFRPWRRSCLAGAGRDGAHVRVEGPDERAIPVPAANYCFMGEREDDEANARCIPILVENFDVDKCALSCSPTQRDKDIRGEPGSWQMQ